VVERTNQLDQDIEENRQESSRIRKKNRSSNHVGKIAAGSVFEGQIAGLMRDYDSLRTIYNQLQAKKLDAWSTANWKRIKPENASRLLGPKRSPMDPAGQGAGIMILADSSRIMCGVGVLLSCRSQDGIGV